MKTQHWGDRDVVELSVKLRRHVVGIFNVNSDENLNMSHTPWSFTDGVNLDRLSSTHSR